MEREKAENFIQANSVLFPADQLSRLVDVLASKGESSSKKVFASTFKQPILAFVLSLFLGGIGVDRFYLGDTLKGVLKLLTCGGIGIWWLVDVIRIMGIVRRRNAEKLVEL